jgi:hypothetical protein
MGDFKNEATSKFLVYDDRSRLFFVSYTRPKDGIYQKISSPTTKELWVYIIETKSGKKAMGWSHHKPPPNDNYRAFKYIPETNVPREMWAYILENLMY